jgi:hypothetical protein
MPLTYASQMIVQPAEYDFILSFFQTRLPYGEKAEEDYRAYLAGIDKIRADCVARITVNPEMIPKIIKALQSTYDGYKAVKDEIEA